ncbi:MAG: hypothetical protein R2684_14170 [Pyrinomonadaceae bacterium]
MEITVIVDYSFELIYESASRGFVAVDGAALRGIHGIDKNNVRAGYRRGETPVIAAFQRHTRGYDVFFAATGGSAQSRSTPGL